MTDLARPLAGRHIFITGATSGFGERFAHVLGGLGAKVSVSGRRVERLRDLVAALSARGIEAFAVPLDVTDLAAIGPALDAAEAELGPLWGLVNNSGVGGGTSIEKETVENYDWIMNTNVKAVYFMAQAAGRRFIERKAGGRIVNIASIAGLRVLPKLSIYCISKAAVVQMTRTMAIEWARHGINVNAICPGYVETEINRDFFATEAGQRMVAKFPRGRIGKVEDLDGIIALMLDPKSDFMTGAVVNVDDGQLLR
ncbi:MAG: SDR family NAD(P)-dependent oxidoreductase [Zavarzinia sp.]|nr:SDR family NAD(P)-dependent oxidoreductase [Zavarzinia sp.]